MAGRDGAADRGHDRGADQGGGPRQCQEAQLLVGGVVHRGGGAGLQKARNPQACISGTFGQSDIFF